MKKILKAGVIALSCASLFALTSCTTTTAVSIAPNWYKNNTLTTAISDTYEKLTYKVEYEKGSNEVYQADYQPGTYTVTLENTTYNNESVYKLTSELQISGSYSMGSEKLDFTDGVVSECYFRDASRMLYPLYSKQTVTSTSPRAEKPNSLQEAVTQYEYTVEVTYNADGKNAKSVYTNLKDSSKNTEQTYSLRNNLTVLDNESLLFAVRGMSVSSQSAVYVLNPYNKAQEQVNVSLMATSTESKHSFINVDEGDTEAKEYTLATNVVNIFRGETLKGKTLTVEYAAPVTGVNAYHCVMLKMQNPLSYNMGTLVYTLTEADFTNK